MAGRLTTTSYCLLGLLNLRPFSAYELTKHMQRSALAELWPRTEAAIYRETRRLADAGLADARTEADGSRPRTVYRIRPEGRRALEDWLAEPGSVLRFECEGAVKAFFGDAADLSALRAQLTALRDGGAARIEAMAPLTASWLEGDLAFPDRIQYTAMAADLIARLRTAADQWAVDWLDRIDAWDGTTLDVTTEGEAIAVIEAIADQIRSAATVRDPEPR